MPKGQYCHTKPKEGDPLPHRHPSHPYTHYREMCHIFPPTSRIKDRKGKKFRHTAAERTRVGAKGTYKTRRGQIKKWD